MMNFLRLNLERRLLGVVLPVLFLGLAVGSFLITQYRSCHAPAEGPLVLLLIEHPGGQFDRWTVRLDRGVVGTGLAVFLAATAVLWLAIRKGAIQPLSRLAAGNKKVYGEGRDDEIGLLVSRLADAARELDRQERLLAFQRQSFNALLSISEAVGENPTVQKVFVQSLEALRGATDFDSIGMRLYDPHRKGFKLVTHYGVSPTMLEILDFVPEDRGFQAEAYRTLWPVCTSDLSTDPRLAARTALDLGYRSLICVPLIAGGRIKGTMELVTVTERHWTEDEVRWLALVGRSIGILIHNVQLTDDLRDFTVLQERSRVAQEIHDGLAQLIGSLRLSAEEAQACMSEGDLTAARTALDDLERMAHDAHASIREELLGLRDTLTPGRDICSALTEYIGRFQRQWGIETRLKFENGQECWKLAVLPTATVIQLLRIFQEALTNIRRHARATMVEVKITESDGRLRVTIQDNGRGFRLDDVPEERLGLRIMRERAAGVGGSVLITSELGSGTKLQIEMPI